MMTRRKMINLAMADSKYSVTERDSYTVVRKTGRNAICLIIWNSGLIHFGDTDLAVCKNIPVRDAYRMLFVK